MYEAPSFHLNAFLKLSYDVRTIYGIILSIALGGIKGNLATVYLWSTRPKHNPEVVQNTHEKLTSCRKNMWRAKLT